MDLCITEEIPRRDPCRTSGHECGWLAHYNGWLANQPGTPFIDFDVLEGPGPEDFDCPALATFVNGEGIAVCPPIS